ncbi:tetratricopeptide repeat protein [Dactylosporangium sp. CS-033363]|uniref:tetratricopeptide repeat protein n=1 Tax=Dactylosporangium sp. CS-033363 TaxID=3239935 RepID=UPI003D935687
MGVVEVEFAGALFPRVLQTLLSQTRIPVPALDALPAGQLVTGLEWGVPQELASAPNGVLVVTAPVSVRHLSLAEFDAGTEAHATAAAVRLRVSALGPRIAVDADRIDIAGVPQAVTWPLVHLDVPATPGLTVYNGAVLQTGAGGDRVVTIRLRTDAFTDILAAPANRIADRDGDWLIRVSGEAVAELLLAAVLDYLGRLGSDTAVEQYPAVQWMPGVWPGEEIGWEAVANFGIRRKDACPGLFGDVDLSVAVTAALRLAPPPVPLPAPPGDRLGLRLWLSTDVSDWDVFRCWAGSGGVGPLLLGGASAGPLALVGLGAFAGIESLIGLGRVVAGRARGDVRDDPPDGFTQESTGDNGTIFRGAIDLPAIEGLDPNVEIAVDADGLIMTGKNLILPAVHEVEYTPRVGPLPGLWLNGDLNCETGVWEPSYRLLRPIEVADEAVIAGRFRTDVPVWIFPTTTATPPDTFGVIWQNSPELSGPPFDPAKVTIQPSRVLDTAVDGALYVHSSAGLVKYTIVTGPPPAPTPSQEREARIRCAQNKIRSLEAAGPEARAQLAAELENLVLLQSAGREYVTAAANAARAADLYAALGNGDGQVRLLIYQGAALSQAGQHDEAIAVTQRAVDLHRGGWELENLCLRLSAAGRYRDSATAGADAAAVYRAAGDLVSTARNLVYQGAALSQAGEHDQAIAATRDAVETHRGGWELENLCLRLSAAGRYRESATAGADAAAVYRADGDLVSTARNLVYQGAALSQAGEHDQAIAATRDAVETHRGGWELENLCLRLSAAGHYRDSATAGADAAAVYRADGDLVSTARNLVYQGGALSHAGEHDQAIAVTGQAVEAHGGGWELENLTLRQAEAERFADAADSAGRAAQAYADAGDEPGRDRLLAMREAYLAHAGG